jgi:hypothetical protein
METVMDIPKNIPMDELEKIDIEMHLLGKEITDNVNIGNLKKNKESKVITQERLDKLSLSQ